MEGKQAEDHKRAGRGEARAKDEEVEVRDVEPATKRTRLHPGDNCGPSPELLLSASSESFGASEGPGRTTPDKCVRLAEAVPGMAGKLHLSARPSEDDRVGSQNKIRKVEFIRLIEQALYALGYQAAAATLEEESQVSLESGAIGALRTAILDGKWEESSGVLRRLSIASDALRQAEFLIQQQKFLECLESSDTSAALSQLRVTLAPLCSDRRRLHQLASWLMCTSREDLLARSNWPGQGSSSRYQLLSDIRALLPPSLMIPTRRLETLIEENLLQQEASCLYHNYPEDSLSLFHEHTCSREMIPSVTTQVLQEHTDEVWYLHFSNDGQRLASASKDGRAIIWEIEDEFHSRVQHVLVGHTKPLSFVAWSPDDSMLLSCGSDCLVKLWDTRSGACLHTFTKHTESVTACAWLPCGRRFVSGGNDKALYIWNIDGQEVSDWTPYGWRAPDSNSSGSTRRGLHGFQLLEQPTRINDLAVSAHGKLMVAVCGEKKIVAKSLVDGTSHELTENQSITSLSMSLDSRYVLVNISSGYIHLWDLEAESQPGAPLQPTSKYKGQVQGRFVIRSCFGGSHQLFIISGSEDSQVYIWHRMTGEILKVLPGHAGTVNAVSWPASRPHMFASASDDRTIRIWGLASAQRPSLSSSDRKASSGAAPMSMSVGNGTAH